MTIPFVDGSFTPDGAAGAIHDGASGLPAVDDTTPPVVIDIGGDVGALIL